MTRSWSSFPVLARSMAPVLDCVKTSLRAFSVQMGWALITEGIRRSAIASSGHILTHLWHATHRSSNALTLLSRHSSAPNEQFSMHLLHSLHACLSMTTLNSGTELYISIHHRDCRFSRAWRPHVVWILANSLNRTLLARHKRRVIFSSADEWPQLDSVREPHHSTIARNSGEPRTVCNHNAKRPVDHCGTVGHSQRLYDPPPLRRHSLDLFPERRS